MNKHLEFVILNCRYNKVEVIHLKRSQKSSKQTSSKMRLNSGISSIFQNSGWNVNYRVPSTQFQKLSKNFKIELPGNSTKSLISPVLWNSHLSETLEYGGMMRWLKKSSTETITRASICIPREIEFEAKMIRILSHLNIIELKKVSFGKKTRDQNFEPKSVRKCQIIKTANNWSLSNHQNEARDRFFEEKLRIWHWFEFVKFRKRMHIRPRDNRIFQMDFVKFHWQLRNKISISNPGNRS